jgi:hypothetical protein
MAWCISQGFTASDIADRDPVRPHPERIANQVPDGYACRPYSSPSRQNGKEENSRASLA